jgi:hypothetical protein
MNVIHPITCAITFWRGFPKSASTVPRTICVASGPVAPEICASNALHGRVLVLGTGESQYAADDGYCDGQERCDGEYRRVRDRGCEALYYSFAGRAAGAEMPDWVKRADSMTDLADQLAIDAIGLEESVRRFNDFVAVGVDADFHRGERAWRLAESAKTNAQKNHSLGSIASAPYYGIELRPSVWSSAGLLTNAQGQVLHQRGHAIAGLYATGNTAARVEFGAGYQAGLVMASGMTFGYLAVEHMLQARVTS